MSDQVRTVTEVDQYIEKLPEDIQEMTVLLRKLILETSPKLVEEFKWSMPNYAYNGLVCYLQTAKKHVNLGFHKGNELENVDKQNVLQGSGKAMRHIRFKKLEDIQPEIITPLIQAAIELNEDEI